MEELIDKIEKASTIVFAAIFLLIAILSLIGGLTGAVWHFYTAIISGLTAAKMLHISKTEHHV